MMSIRKGALTDQFDGAEAKRVRTFYLERRALISVRVRLRGVEQGCQKVFHTLSARLNLLPSKDDGSRAELVRQKEMVSKQLAAAGPSGPRNTGPVQQWPADRQNRKKAHDLQHLQRPLATRFGRQRREQRRQHRA
jgi:hypothetical protein